MKSFITSVLLLLALLLPGTAVAFDLELDGIYYDLNGTEATVTRGTIRYSGEVTIPARFVYNGTTYRVTGIGDQAFDGCSRLSSVTIPNTVRSIGQNAFYDCYALSSLTIPQSVSFIDSYAFPYCRSLVSITVDSGNLIYDSRNNCNAIIETASNKLIVGCENTIIPSTVTAIDEGAFEGRTGLESVDIPNSVIRIGRSAFWGCGLKSVTIPKSVRVIGEKAFQACTDMTSMVVEAGNPIYDSRDNCNAIIMTSSNTLVQGCRSTVIPTSVTAIGDRAFDTCFGLTGIDIPNSVITIGSSAFFHCSYLKSVTIPESVTSIGSRAFAWCYAMNSIKVAAGNPVYDSRDNCNAIIVTSSNKLIKGCMSTVIPSSITAIGDEAFYLCSGLSSVTLPQSLIFIGKEAFSECRDLKDVFSHITQPGRVSIGRDAFYDDNYSGRTLHVQRGTAGAYQADTRWSDYFAQIVEDIMPPELPGDVNADGEVDIADINAVMDIIMGEAECIAAADVNGDGEVNIADINAIINILAGEEHPHEYVDLGLPSGTLWATCNIGASSPEDYGDYFAWGETSPKDIYDWGTYKWCDGSATSLTKYNYDSNYGTVDNKTMLEPEDDAAFVNWGPNWRLPTRNQYNELEENCTWKWTTRNGVGGYLVTGRNGNSLFLPAAGYRNGNSIVGLGTSGYYWSHALYPSSGPTYAAGMDFTQWGHVGGFGAYRSNGCVVRPVCVSLEDVYIEQKSLDLGGTRIGETSTGELTIVNCSDEPVMVTATVDAPFSFKQDDSSASTITLMVPSESSTQVTVMFTAATVGDFNGRVTIESPALTGGQLGIPVHALAFTAPDTQQDYVDLGLPSGTLWATRDVGANSPEENGDRFAWGETAPKDFYNVSNYQWCEGSYTTLTKYCTSSRYGTVDDLVVLEPEDDAATVNWGPEWCMPSLRQIQELIDCCSFTRAEVNGVIVRLVTGPNGNTMYMPADGYYWSHTLYGASDYAYGLRVDSGDWYWNYFWGPRADGHQVRAVRVAPDNLNIYIEQRSLDLGEVPVGETCTGELTIVNNTGDTKMLKAQIDTPFYFKQGEGYSSSMTILMAGHSTHTVTVLFTPTSPGEFSGDVMFSGSALDGGQRAIPIQAIAR